METHIFDEKSIIIIIKGKTFRELYYQILPSITYTDNEMFPYEDKSLFNNLNINEHFFDLIIIGKKILKQQIDFIKNEILQKTVCDINHLIFEYEDILDNNIELKLDYHNIIINGVNDNYKVQYILRGNSWIEKINSPIE